MKDHTFFSLFSFFYRVISHRRIFLYLFTAAIIIVSALILKNIKMNEDIAPLLPDGQNEAARDFALLRKAPFSGKILVNLQGGADTDKNDLVNAADMLVQAMTGSYFTEAIAGPVLPAHERTLEWLTGSIPGTFTENDMITIKKKLTLESVRATLQKSRIELASPEGWFLKPLLQSDPLEMRTLTMEKFQHLNIMPSMKLFENHFISADGKNTLVIIDTPVEITDSKGSKELMAHLQGLIEKIVPSGIDASVISAHAYTTANAEVIKSDLITILSCSSVAIFLLILAFLRSWKGILVFLVPSSVLCLATAGTLLIYDSVSAVTLAFGSVLLGISDDYPILVYFALSRKERNPEQVVGTVARPVLFGGITTILTFGVMLLSNLPGQRQLAVFSIIGVTVALVFSLIILPHLLQSLPGEKHYISSRAAGFPRMPRRLFLVLWLVVVGLSLWQAGKLHFNGDLQVLNMVPAELHKAEQHISDAWGDFRENAILFSEGKDLQSALEINDNLFSFLKEKIPEKQIISLAPVLPSEKTQRENRLRWSIFWSGENKEYVKKLLIDEGDKAGFSSAAFTPFFETLDAVPPPITLEGFKAAGLGEITNSLITKEEEKTQILTLVPDTLSTVSLFDTNRRSTGVRLVSQNRFRGLISKALVGNFINYIFLALLVIIISVSILFRNIKKIILALIPVATGLIFMVGTMGFTGIEFNLFNIVATILVIGIGIDLGIFMVCNVSDGYDHTASLGILLGGLTSFVGLGTLTLARHPALNSIGITVLLGLCGVIPSALFIIPALHGLTNVKR